MTDKKRILFVDDEPNMLKRLSRILYDKRQVWEIDFAQSVDEAIEVLNKGSIDAVISDLAMPNKNGFDLLQTIRNSELTEDIPVVILTARNDGGLKRKALELGATDLLNKPVDEDELMARISSMLKLKACQDKLKSYNQYLEQKIKERADKKTLLQEKLNESLQRELEIEKVKAGIIEPTMHEVHDIVGNLLINLLLFRMKAKDSHAISEKLLKLFDEIVKEASSKIRIIG